MEACLLLLPPRLLLLGTAILIVSAPDTADLVALCGQTRQVAGLLLRSHPASRRFYFVAPDTDCALWVRAAAPGDRIRFQFRFFLVYSLTPGAPEPRASAAPNASSAEPTDRCFPGSYLQFYEGPAGAPRPLGDPLCGLTIPDPVASSGPVLGLRLATRGRRPRVDFVGEVTSFRLGSCGPYFRCENSVCIPPSLVCDPWDMDNCGDGSDQASWPPASCRGPSLVPSPAGSTGGQAPTLPTLPAALRSAGTICATAGSTVADPDAQQATARAGPRLHGVALAALLLLASAGLLVGLLCCCCCSSRLACGGRARGLGLSCTICYLSPDQWGDVAWCVGGALSVLGSACSSSR
ncbi:PREDICTED: low-density lipoprotein receptor class A domain-containing protein 2 [Condylura cristata]|uniref:low-density lipoprotein receptor class A domain-containing protein 2 n=1 Tax=Condylura cristata TaxID=143302 RepID=UPI0003344F4A|nr:PREDICTED: low-density lipoprotein receptor class A domain-containing protein 2 [Condylura cristata]